MGFYSKLFVLFGFVLVNNICFAEEDHEKHHAPAHYKFDYAVYDPHTGDKKQQYEERHGKVVKGAYSFLEADGTTRVVEYTADPHNGFTAVVKRIGHAHHPQHYHKHEAPSHEGWGKAYSTIGVTHFGYH